MKKKTAQSYIPLLVFLIGLSLLLYPTISDRWNAMHQSQAIVSYAHKVDNLDTEQNRIMWHNAENFNAGVVSRDNQFRMSDEELARYETLLNIDGNGIMGYVEIPSINCRLPVYHGTEEKTLQVGVGHIEWSSLPVGGESTHAVLSGHRGLPSARLFTDLNKLTEGDHFLLYVLSETLTYEVDQIRIVEPEDISDLQIQQGLDLCTLVTCTPYGINTHRLLIRGHRIENEVVSTPKFVTSDAARINPKLVALAIGVLNVSVILILMTAASPFRRKHLRRTK